MIRLELDLNNRKNAAAQAVTVTMSMTSLGNHHASDRPRAGLRPPGAATAHGPLARRHWLQED